MAKESKWEHITTFVIPGQPRSKGRPRFTNTGHAYTPKTTRDAERLVIDLFELNCPLWEPTLENVRLTVKVRYKGKVIGDGDNVYKLIADALQGFAFVNDKQIRKGKFKVSENAGDRCGVVVSFAIYKGES